MEPRANLLSLLPHFFRYSKQTCLTTSSWLPPHLYVPICVYVLLFFCQEVVVDVFQAYNYWAVGVGRLVILDMLLEKRLIVILIVSRPLPSPPFFGGGLNDWDLSVKDQILSKKNNSNEMWFLWLCRTDYALQFANFVRSSQVTEKAINSPNKVKELKLFNCTLQKA